MILIINYHYKLLINIEKLVFWFRWGKNQHFHYFQEKVTKKFAHQTYCSGPDFFQEHVNRLIKVWKKDFKEKINVVLGDEWYAGNISYHMEGRPVWLGEINQKNVDLLNAYISTKKVCVGYRWKK